MRETLDIKDRLLSHILIDENGCWNWTGSKNKQGYGSIGVGSRKTEGRRGYSYSEEHPSAKLTEEDVFTARKLRRNGYSYYRLAKMYGINRETMRQAVLGITWNHLKTRRPPEGEEGDVNRG